MGYIKVNPNPSNKAVGDCVIRALSLALDKSWKETYALLALYGYSMNDMPSSNAVWDAVLLDNGFERDVVHEQCPSGCYTVSDFCADRPFGTFVLGTGTHVVTIKNGCYMDSWDSGDEIPIYYYREVNYGEL